MEDICNELIEQVIENRISLLSIMNEIRDLKLVLIGLFVGIGVVIIMAIVWGYRYE